YLLGEYPDWAYLPSSSRTNSYDILGRFSDGHISRYRANWHRLRYFYVRTQTGSRSGKRAYRDGGTGAQSRVGFYRLWRTPVAGCYCGRSYYPRGYCRTECTHGTPPQADARK